MLDNSSYEEIILDSEETEDECDDTNLNIDNDDIILIENVE